jgi:hypothetical protein
MSVFVEGDGYQDHPPIGHRFELARSIRREQPAPMFAPDP